MDVDLVEKIALVGALGLGSQWLAWKFNLPAIVLLTVAGLVAGPVLGWLDPARDFGELMTPLVGAAVAVILFEGGLHLSFRKLGEAARAVRRLVFVGVPIGWLLGSAAVHYVAGLSWPVALLFGGILVVTGPTVIMPLLRQAKLSPQPAAILKWEGILNDPVGALLAVMVFEYVTLRGDAPLLNFLGVHALAIAAAASLGAAAGWLFRVAFRRGYMAEFLKGPAILALVLVCYAAGNMLLEEAGLVAVTVLGVTLANSRLASIDQMRRFKEYMAVLLVSGVFILLTATLTTEHLALLDWRMAGFVAVLLFVVRPLTVWLATVGAGIEWRQRLLVAWIAPRGIVAVAISGLFAGGLTAHGIEEGALLVPLSFAVVFATVVAHGFSIRWLARRLDLASGPEHGVLIVGANPWTVGLAKALKERDIPVLVVDTNPNHLALARRAGVEIFDGDILSEPAEHEIDLNRFDHLLAATDNDAYNALVCSQFGPELGRNNVLQVAPAHEGDDDPDALRETVRGRTFVEPELDYPEFERRLNAGWAFKCSPAQSASPDKGVIVGVVGEDGAVKFRTPETEIKSEEEDTLVVFAPA